MPYQLTTPVETKLPGAKAECLVASTSLLFQ